MNLDEADPKGLVRESYAIDGITLPECRSIFLDWALSLGAGLNPADSVAALLAHYGRADHPMSVVLTDGLGAPVAARRRGGRAGRMHDG